MPRAWSFLAMLVSAVFFFAAGTAQADPMFEGPEILVSADSFDQRRPDVAFDGNRFLVVWEDNKSGTFDINGRFFTRAGVPDGAEFVISSSSFTKERVEVRFNGTKYLVAWTDLRGAGGTESNIYGQLVTTAGAIEGPEIAISTQPGYQQKPNIATDGTNFLVVWMDNRNYTTFDTYGQIVSNTGSLLGAEIPISTATGAQERPLAKFNGTDYFVVWNDSRNGEFDIIGRVVDTSGALLGDEMQISVAPGHQTHPQIDFDGTNYLIVWRDFRNDPSMTMADIYGQKISTTGITVGAELSINTIPGIDKRAQDLVYTGDNRYLLIYDPGCCMMMNGALHGQFLKKSGAVFGPEILINPSGSRGRMAFDGQNFLVAWSDNRSGYEYDLYAQLIKNVVTVTTATMPSGTTGIPYNQPLAASGGVPPYTWQLDPANPGMLPPGLTLNVDGTITGTPAVAGTYTFSPLVADSYFSSRGKTLTMTVNAGAPGTNINVNLSFPNEAGYSTDGIQPDSGDTNTVFTYKVVYTSVYNTPPLNMNLCIDNACNPMQPDPSATGTLADGQYSDGEQYIYSTNLPAGTHDFKFRTFDGTEYGKLPYPGSFAGPTVVTAPPPPDTIPPVTYPTLLNITDNGPRHKILSIGAVDDDGSGTYAGTISAINYSINGGPYITVNFMTADIYFTQEGSYDVVYYAVDASGNTSAPGSVTVLLDLSPPVVSVVDGTITLPPGATYVGSWPALTQFVTASDNLSWVSLHFTIPGVWGQFYFTPGVYTVTWYGVDQDGNTSAGATHTLTVNTSSTAYGQLSGGTTVQVSAPADQTLSNVAFQPYSGTPPPGVQFPVGSISYNVTAPSGQATTTFTFTPALTGPIALYKIDGSGASTPIPSSDWTASTAGASTVITLTLTDGSVFDLDGIVNGIIVDPVAPAVIVNFPPVSSAGADRDVFAGEMVILDGLASSDPESAPLNYHWTLDSKPVGSTAALAGAATSAPSFYADVTGQYIISLVVDDGVVASTSDSIIVNATVNLPPTVTLSSDITSGFAPLNVNLTASGVDPEGSAITYSWDFGDGTTTTGGSLFSHVYSSAGVYPAVVTAKDAFGNTAQASVEITVKTPNTPPAASPYASSTSGVAPHRVLFTANASDPDGNALVYSWDFGDGGSAQTADPEHIYNSPGSYVATVTVSDGQYNATGSINISVGSALSINVTEVKLDFGDRGKVAGKVNLKAAFTYPYALAGPEVISASVDGIEILAIPFANFTQDEDKTGEYEYEGNGLHAKLDFNKNTLKISRHKMVLTGIDASNGLDVKVSFGASSAVDNVSAQERNEHNKKRELNYKD